MLDRLVLLADEYGREIDTLAFAEGDFTNGGDIPSFELSVSKELDIKQNRYIIVDESEFGGIIDDIDDDSLEDYYVVSGRTWDGILKDTPAKPDSGSMYVTVSGDANQCIKQLLDKFSQSNILIANPEPSGFVLSNYAVLSMSGNRFFDLLSGIRRMLISVGAKLKFTYDSSLRKVVLSAVARGVYIEDGLDGDVVPIRIKVKRAYNHFECVGGGEGLARITCDVYADVDGNVSDKQTIFGNAYRGKIYENVNCDNVEDLHSYGVERLSDEQAELKSCSLSDEVAEAYDIDDVVGARSIDQGIEIITSIAEKIGTFDENGNFSVSVKTELEVN